MLDPIYVLDRAITLTLCIFLLLLAIAQSVAAKLLRQSQTKHYTHYWVAFSVFFLFLATIDLGGLFKVYPFECNIIFMAMATMGTLGAMSVMIISHFRAHFLSLKREMPKHFTHFFFLPLTLGFIITPLGNLLIFYDNTNRYTPLLFSNAFLVMGLMYGANYYGYYRIRLILIEAIKLENPNYKTSWCVCYDPNEEQVTKKSNTMSRIDYKALLNRLFKLHLGIFICAVIYLSTLTISTIPVLQNPRLPPVYLNPNSYSFDMNTHLTIFGQGLMLWWAWINIKDIKEKYRSSCKSSKGSTESQGQSPKQHNSTLEVSETGFGSPSTSRVRGISTQNQEDTDRSPTLCLQVEFGQQKLLSQESTSGITIIGETTEMIPSSSFSKSTQNLEMLELSQQQSKPREQELESVMEEDPYVV